MPKTDKEMREELARIRTEEIQKKTAADNALTEINRADARAKAADELAAEGMTTDPRTGRKATYQEMADQKTHDTLTSEVNAYNDWRQAIMSLWNIYTLRATSLAHFVKETITVPLANGFVDIAVLPFHDFVKGKFTGNPDVDLPALQHEVTFTDDDKLSIAPLTRSDNVDKTRSDYVNQDRPAHAPKPLSLDDLFDQGVRLWLNEQGYTESPDDKSKFVNEHGVGLKKADFELLKNDPDNGLEHFLSRYSELEFRPRGP